MRAARPALAVAVALGAVGSAAVLAQAVALAAVVGRVFADPRRHSAATVAGLLAVIGAAVAVRALVGLASEVATEHGATSVRHELRTRLLGGLVDSGPERLAGERSGELVTTATRGIDALELYFSGYLPQLALAAIAPVLFLVWMVTADWLSAAIVAATLVVVPVFMVLLGQEAAARMRRQWAELSRLTGHFADVVRGIRTLKAFDRVDHQLATIAATTDRLRRATMSTLRYAFLSSFVFELLASVATALVALVLGLRLLAGALPLQVALAVLLVVPEVFLPLRAASAKFHAAADGVGASDRLLELLAPPAGRRATQGTVALAGRTPGAGEPLVELRHATVQRPRSDFRLGPVDLAVRPGETVAVVGPTGCGKSTLLALLLGELEPSGGEVCWSVDDPAAGLAAWRARCSWLPARPGIVTGTVAENVALTSPGADRDRVAWAIEQAGAGPVVAELPAGAETVLGEQGLTLSSGERQRIGLARALCRPADCYLLDEPTAHLDARTEHEVLDRLFAAVAGSALVVVTHSPAVAARCERVLDLSSPAGGPAPSRSVLELSGV